MVAPSGMAPVMKLKRLWALILPMLLLAGCQLDLPPVARGQAPLDTPLTLSAGQAVAIDDGAATLRMEVWADDKRCPSSLECAESGPVRVQISLWRNGHATAYPVFAVHTDAEGAVIAGAPGTADTHKVGPYVITVTAVTPYPVDAQRIPMTDYQATLVVSKDPTALPDTDADMNIATERPIVLAPGEQVTLVGRDTVLRVDAVNDRRCPPAQKCATASAVEVTFDWLENGTARKVVLGGASDADGAIQPAPETARPFELVNGVGIRLLSVTPPPAPDGEIAQGEYRVTFMLEPGPRMPNGSEFAEPGATFELAPGRAAVIGSDQLRVRFDEVVQDFRCPRQMLCTQAGEVKVAVTVANDQQRATSYILGGSTDYTGTLHTPALITHDGYTVQLTAVAPYPEGAETTIAADAYVATFVVESLEPSTAPPPASAPAAAQPDNALLPLLCINDFAVIRMSIGGPAEPAIRFTEPVAQDAATDYGAAHALCNKTFGPEWVQAGPSNLADYAPYLPAEADFWVWDGMAGSLVRQK